MLSVKLWSIVTVFGSIAIIAGVIVFLHNSNQAKPEYLLRYEPRASSTEGWRTFIDASFGLFLRYPSEWQTQAFSDSTGEILSLHLIFLTGNEVSPGFQESTPLVFGRYQNPLGMDLDSFLRSKFKDPKRLLVLRPCSFVSSAQGQCVEVVERAAWQRDAGTSSLDLPFRFFLAGVNYIYGVSLGQEATFDSDDIMVQILETVRLQAPSQ